MLESLTSVDFLLGASGGWDIESFLSGATGTIQGWLGLAFVLVGIIMIAVGAWQGISKLMSSGQSQHSYVKAIITVLFGGALSIGGFAFIQSIAKGGKKTIEDLPNGAIVVNNVTDMAQSLIPFL